MRHLILITIAILAITTYAQSQNKNVLLITSAQKDLLSEDGKAWGFTKASDERNKVRENLKKLIAKARAKNMPIIHSPVGFDYKKMKGYQPINGIQNVIIENQLLAMHSPGTEFIVEATPKQGEIVLPFRQGFSSFWANSIQRHLKRLNVDTIYIAGMLAEGCVQSHTRDAVENGYSTIVIVDAIGSTSLDLLDASYKTLGLHAKSLIKTEDFLTN